MSLSDRLKALEQTVRDVACPACGAGGEGGLPRPVVFSTRADEVSPPCETCGRTPKVIRVRAAILSHGKPAAAGAAE